LASSKRVTPAKLDGLDFIAFDEDLPIRKDIDSYLKDNGAEIHETLHFDNLQSIKEAVLLGRGISIVPFPVIEKEVAERRLVAAELSPSLNRPLGVIHRKHATLSRAARAFLDLLMEDAAN
jgi:DNA-binding transcriptional LysR family regulator